MEDSFKIERWIFAGKTELQKGGVGVKFILLDDKNNITETKMIYDTKKVSYAPGCIYEIEAKREGDGCSARFSTIKLIAKHDDPEIVEKFQLENKLITTRIEALKLEKKYNYGYDLPDSWDEIVSLYSKLSYSNKQTFETLLLTKLKKDARILTNQ